jgi:hypothetical protein
MIGAFSLPNSPFNAAESSLSYWGRPAYGGAEGDQGFEWGVIHEDDYEDEKKLDSIARTRPALFLIVRIPHL